MRILLLSSSGIHGGGAAKSAYRLLKAITKSGADAKILVQNKFERNTLTFCPPTTFKRIPGLLRPHIERLCTKCLYPSVDRLFSSAFVPDNILKQVKSYNPDVINLHWVAGGFIMLESLLRFKKPIVWTLHDSWAFTGGCHLPYDCTAYVAGCGLCPALKSNFKHDLSWLNFMRKRRVYGKLNMTIVSPSGWLSACAKQSSLLHPFEIRTVPNCVDTDVFKPIEKYAARKILNLDQRKKIVLFGAMGSVADSNKGFSEFCEIMRKMHKENYQIVVFGSEAVSSVDGLNINFLGKLSDEYTLALLYSAADVFVSTSHSENFPNTILEAMACGTPCVAFSVGGIPDLITHKKDGYLAELRNTEDFAHGIEWVLSGTSELELSKHSRAKVRDRFSLSVIAEKYISVYRDALHITKRQAIAI